MRLSGNDLAVAGTGALEADPADRASVEHAPKPATGGGLRRGLGSPPLLGEIPKPRQRSLIVYDIR